MDAPIPFKCVTCDDAAKVTKIVKHVRGGPDGALSIVADGDLTAKSTPAEIAKAIADTTAQIVTAGIMAQANERLAGITQQANDVVAKAVEHVKEAATAAAKTALGKADEDQGERTKTFTPAASMSPKARAEAEARYARMVEADDDDEPLDEEQLSALEDVMHELDHAVRSLAKAYGMDDDEVIEDLGPPRKRTRPPTTTRPLVLDDRPEFRFPDATDVGRAASETSDEDDEPDDEDAGQQRRHKSRHRRVSKRRHLGPIMGPRRWQR